MTGAQRAHVLLATATTAADAAAQTVRDLPRLTVGDTLARAQVLATVAQASALAGLLALRLEQASS